MWKPVARLLLLAYWCWLAAPAASQVTNEAQLEPSICDVCKCTKASNGQTNVQCSDALAAYEVTRDDVWPTALRLKIIGRICLKILRMDFGKIRKCKVSEKKYPEIF